MSMHMGAGAGGFGTWNDMELHYLAASYSLACMQAGDRKAAQLDQAKSWWEEQAAQKAAMKAAEAEAEMAAAELVKYQDLVQRDSAAQEASIRREMNAATVDVNARLAEERRLREQYAKAADRAASAAELDASLSSPFMTEDPSLAASALSTLRVRRDHFKGMTEGEKAAIHDVQLAQVEEKRARLAAAILRELTRRIQRWQKGQETSTFRRHPQPLCVHLSFSLIYTDQ